MADTIIVKRSNTAPVTLDAGRLFVDLDDGVLYFGATSGPVACARVTQVRELLTANRTYYVRTDGSDSNNGLANTSGGAFATLQKAINVVSALDRSTYNVTIQMQAGGTTHTTGGSVTGLGPGTGTVEILGDAATPTNCIVSTTSSTAFRVVAPVAVIINGFKIQTTTSGSCIYADNNASVILKNINFGAAAYAHILSWWGAKVDIQSNYTISGGGARHWWALSGGINAAGYTVTISGTPAFSEYFAAATVNGSIYAVQTWSGSATGVQYYYDAGSSIFTAGGTLPGSTAGVSSPGATTSGRVVLANGASTTVTHAADASNLRRAKFYEYVVTGTADNPVQFQADFNGTNGATSYTDQSVYMRTITFSGSAALNTSVKKYGTASLSLPSSGGGYITIPNACFNVGTGNFCIEFWMYLTALPGSTGYVIDTRSGGADSAVSPLVYINSSGSVKWHTNNIDRISSANLSATTWYHISFCRSSGTLTMYVNGTSAGTWADSTNYSIAGAGLIGKSSGSPLYLNGYLDDFVIRNDAYRTGTFTPPTELVATYNVTLKPRAESVVTILHDNGAGANRSTQTTATNASGGTLQGELIVIQ
jgi:hypothetical protein